jgi:hypothetical protein
MLAGVVVPIAIMPWYGISPTAWYKAWIPSSLLSKLKGFRNEEVLNADIEKQDDADQERDDESREDG